VYSAGAEPLGHLNPYAIKVMTEVGIDISAGYSKNIKELHGIDFDYVVTLCDSAKGTCPTTLKAKKIIHKDFSMPDYFRMNESERIGVFRNVRDEIASWIKETFSDKESSAPSR
jgi:arsenate reductase